MEWITLRLGLIMEGVTFPTQGVAHVLLMSLFQSFLWLNLMTLSSKLRRAMNNVVNLKGKIHKETTPLA
jgi:hypothetical protein